MLTDSIIRRMVDLRMDFNSKFWFRINRVKTDCVRVGVFALHTRKTHSTHLVEINGRYRLHF